MAESDIYSLPSRLRMQMLINEQNSTNLLEGIDYEFETPKPSHSSGMKYNTSLVLRFKGEREGIKERVLYRRLSLDYVRKNKDPVVIKLSEDFIKTSQILSFINRHYGLSLDMSDLVEEIFDLNSALYYECKVAPSSLAWNRGTLPFIVDKQVPPLSDALPTFKLDGLYAPTTIN